MPKSPQTPHIAQPKADVQPMRGIAFKLASVVVFMGLASVVKIVSPEIPAGQIVFFRSFFAIPVIVVWLIWRAELWHGLKVVSPMGHVWRGLVGTCAMGLGFAGLGLLPLPEVTAIGYATPILVVIFAAMFLGEEVRLFRLSAVALGMIGVLIVLSPRLAMDVSLVSDAVDPERARQALGAMFVLGSAICAALAQVFVRKLVATEGTAAIVFYFSVTASVLALVTVPYGWVIPNLKTALLLVFSGFLGGIGQILLTSSYRHGDASLIAPFEYASMLLALAVGYFVFDEAPTGTMLIGAGIIMIAGILIIWRERQLGIERARQRKAMTPQG